MKQETGNNNPTATKKVSIQLKLGGHSFSSDMLPAEAADADMTEVIVPTEKCVLVPASVFEPQAAEQYLSINGLPCDMNECAVCSQEKDGTVAVIAVASECVKIINDYTKGKAVFTTPLLHKYDNRGNTLYIYIYGGVAFLKLYNDDKLRFAEAVRICNNDDVLYYTSLLAEEFDLGSYAINVSGDSASNVVHLLKHYYKNVRCA